MSQIPGATGGRSQGTRGTGYRMRPNGCSTGQSGTPWQRRAWVSRPARGGRAGRGGQGPGRARGGAWVEGTGEGGGGDAAGGENNPHGGRGGRGARGPPRHHLASSGGPPAHR